MLRQFTSTVYVFHEGKVLLHLHPKHHKWMPPGGHLEANETPTEAARREVLEETGLEIAFIQDEKIDVQGSESLRLERPILCLLEDIPARKGEEAHQHIDFIFLAEAVKPIGKAFEPFQWLIWEEVKKMPKEDFFSDTLKVIEYVLAWTNREHPLETLSI
jgi:8-oxo-dGTP pyrophosphatase MutT (NUDIX family)